MKYFPFVLCLILFTGCKKTNKIQFTGTTPGIKSGTFVIKTQRDSTVIGVNIQIEEVSVYVNEDLSKH